MIDLCKRCRKPATKTVPRVGGAVPCCGEAACEAVLGAVGTPVDPRVNALVEERRRETREGWPEPRASVLAPTDVDGVGPKLPTLTTEDASWDELRYAKRVSQVKNAAALPIDEAFIAYGAAVLALRDAERAHAAAKAVLDEDLKAVQQVWRQKLEALNAELLKDAP